MVSEGDTAPNFSTTMASGEGDLDRFELAAAIGDGPVVLVFFPSAFSPGCRMELQQFRDNLAEFEALSAEVYGVSTDMPYALGAFVEANDLDFPLLTDYNQDIIRDYDVRVDELGGLKGLAERSVFVIDGEGEVAYRWVGDDPADLPDVDVVVEQVEAVAATA